MKRFFIRFAGLAALTVVLSGCSIDGRFYPVQGALASQNPAPFYVARFTAHPPTSFTVSGVIAGEPVKGTLVCTLPAPKNPPNVPVPAPMTSQWDAIYGAGAYTAHVLGSGQDARGVLTSASGTTYQVEIHTPISARSGDAAVGVVIIQGVAQDNKGNLFKVAF